MNDAHDKKQRKDSNGEQGGEEKTNTEGGADGERTKPPWRKKKHKHALGAKARKRAKNRAAHEPTVTN